MKFQEGQTLFTTSYASLDPENHAKTGELDLRKFFSRCNKVLVELTGHGKKPVIISLDPWRRGRNRIHHPHRRFFGMSRFSDFSALKTLYSKEMHLKYWTEYESGDRKSIEVIVLPIADFGYLVTQETLTSWDIPSSEVSATSRAWAGVLRHIQFPILSTLSIDLEVVKSETAAFVDFLKRHPIAALTLKGKATWNLGLLLAIPPDSLMHLQTLTVYASPRPISEDNEAPSTTPPINDEPTVCFHHLTYLHSHHSIASEVLRAFKFPRLQTVSISVGGERNSLQTLVEFLGSMSPSTVQTLAVEIQCQAPLLLQPHESKIEIPFRLDLTFLPGRCLDENVTSLRSWMESLILEGATGVKITLPSSCGRKKTERLARQLREDLEKVPAPVDIDTSRNRKAKEEEAWYRMSKEFIQGLRNRTAEAHGSGSRPPNADTRMQKHLRLTSVEDSLQDRNTVVPDFETETDRGECLAGPNNSSSTSPVEPEATDSESVIVLDSNDIDPGPEEKSDEQTDIPYCAEYTYSIVWGTTK
ncbi:hypothetical protein B0H11DRAFT_2291203 [Mycena galericulata]|nr:hypothetical protein B0H11DRAFT_2291203 [Mycena galericulata]